jgi:hypothetical protein
MLEAIKEKIQELAELFRVDDIEEKIKLTSSCEEEEDLIERIKKLIGC